MRTRTREEAHLEALQKCPHIGVDEAGRGPLAGPVIAAAVLLPSLESFPILLTDSKKLSEKRRAQAYLWLKRGAKLALGAASAEEIDQLNILQASMLAMERAVLKLAQPTLPVLIDGNCVPKRLEARASAIIKGDQRCASISAASICAKVVRDRIMQRLEQRYPGYGFKQHKGYPTKQHRQALLELGPCPAHRRSFRLA